MSNAKIKRQQPTVYIGEDQLPINGFIVSGTLFPWNEYFEVRVPELNAVLVKEAVDALIANREAIDALNPPDGESESE